MDPITDDKMDLNVACCLCVRNNYNYLPFIFDNLNQLSDLFTQFAVIFVYDNCTDNSEILLEQFRKESSFSVYVIHNVNNHSPHRTIRIASSRNMCMQVINDLKTIDVHFMIDADNVNVPKWNIPLIRSYLNRYDWDALSFNRPGHYYDIWALLYTPYLHHCWGWNTYENDCKMVRLMESEMTTQLNALKDDELFVCKSAFNGFAIYRTPVFHNIRYDGEYYNIKPFLSDEDRLKTIDFILDRLPDLRGNIEINDNNIELCEHLHFHLSAIQKYNARIRISKFCISDIPIP